MVVKKRRFRNIPPIAEWVQVYKPNPSEDVVKAAVAHLSGVWT